MKRWLIMLAIPAAAAAAQTVPRPPAIDAVRAAARAVDQSVQAPRTGQESLDRTAPLLTVEPQPDPAETDADEAAWRKAREADAMQQLAAEKPKPE